MSERVVVENNYLDSTDKSEKTRLEYKEQKDQITDMEQHRLSELGIKDIQSTQKLVDACSNGISPAYTNSKKNQALEILIVWGNLTGIPLDVFLTQQEITPEKVAEILNSTPPTTEAKALQFATAMAYLAFAKNGKEIPSWDAVTDQYSFKDTDKVIDIEHPNGQLRVRVGFTVVR
ncbi:TPA: DUF6862 domain-containing protein [Proteus mirabilis]|uniref:DUF6862 domain-containing protein n=1 Tax=Proteus mirabilis TaxID=584 RepID=UPI0007A5A3A7|nr:hypothetical protein [Proteus mirabilis]ELA8072576.1 hypothetical protein [Proteus mirabilis]ELJ9400673.1 hypothetical protein [Proteus mirabilis]ELJ9438568.1 hypothetical protein [Proteus mirabilis]ELS1786145.1 hypothetical protein [Proteus mirabilis]ELS1792914.1 hypothetical protein [Proteus mirabilis]